MKKVIGFGFLAMCLTALSSVSFATTLCSADIGADVTTLNAGGGCTIGNWTFNNFNPTTAGGSGTPLVQLAAAYDGTQAGPEPPPGEVGLNFNPNLGGIGSTVTDIHFTFSVTNSTKQIIDAFLFNGGTANSQIQERLCTVGVSQSGACTGVQLGSDMVANGGQTVGPNFFSPANPVWIWKDINITNVSTDHISSFDQTFSATVPEPMTLSMMGVGLLGLGFLGRRLRK
jgi:hypothetical protein